MGTTGGKVIYSGTTVKFSIEAHGPEIAQVAHPKAQPFDSEGAAKVLTELSQVLPESVRMIVTGGGFVTLTYDGEAPKKSIRRKTAFLETLRKWTSARVKDLVAALRKVEGREFLVGIDVLVDGDGSGQFGLWIRQTGSTLVSKRFPVNNEATYLAGVEAEQQERGPRVVKSTLGTAMVLVCHDAQAFNHLTIARVNNAKAKEPGPRKRGMNELHEIARDEKPRWMFDLIHSVANAGNLKTFKRSFEQIHADCLSTPSVVGAFGYGTGKAKQAAGWLAQLRQPPGLNAVTVVIESK